MHKLQVTCTSYKLLVQPEQRFAAMHPVQCLACLAVACYALHSSLTVWVHIIGIIHEAFQAVALLSLLLLLLI
jgi:hypothetical protein